MTDSLEMNRRKPRGTALDGTLHGRRHEEEMLRIFGEVRFSGDAPVIDKGLCILAFFNRSGSNLLGEYLSALPGAGGFRERLNWNQVARRQKRLGLGGFPEHVRHLAETEGGARLWGVKASDAQLSYLLRWNIPAMFRTTRVIHIRRNDLVAQAVSLHFANQTGNWHSGQGEAGEAADEVPYDFKGLRRKIRSIQENNANIEVLTTVTDLPLQTIIYEHLLEKPAETVNRLGDFLGLDPEDRVLPVPRVRKQSTSAKTRMVGRLREDLAQSVLSDDITPTA